MRFVVKVIIDARRLSREERFLLIGTAIKKVGTGEIVALADDENSREDISYAAEKHGWMLNGVEVRGDSYRITITPTLPRAP
jgi:hypothetical protein